MRFGTLKNSLGLSNLGNRIAEFRRDESGVMIVFTLYLFIAMLIITGISVDLARVELVRTKLQNTLDRAILAAADIDNSAKTEAEVQDIVLEYFAKANLQGYVTRADIVVGGDHRTSRTVEVAANAQVPSWFLKFAGVDTLLAPAGGKAEERISEIEVVLVLDVSGSMTNRGSTKMTDLKRAAADFVTKVLQSADAQDRISISVVPYNAQVRVHPDILAEYSRTGDIGAQQSNCVRFGDVAHFQTTALPTVADPNDPNAKPSLEMYDYFETTDAWNPARNNSLRTYCSTIPGQQIILPSNNPAHLAAEIGWDTVVNSSTGFVEIAGDDATYENTAYPNSPNSKGLRSSGWTSIDTGVKWGAVMLDPSMRGVLNFPSGMSDRPFDWDNDEVGKILIIMTDGANTEQVEIGDDYDSGTSNFYHTGTNPLSGSLSIHLPNAAVDPNRPYYYVNNRPNGWNEWYPTPHAGATQANWSDIFASRGTKLVSEYYAEAYGTLPESVQAALPTRNVVLYYWRGQAYYGDVNATDSRYWDEEILSYVSDEASMDTNTKSICSTLERVGLPAGAPPEAENNLTIYSIAFQAAEAGATLLRECATEAPPAGTAYTEDGGTYYYVGSGEKIGDVFDLIARDLVQLRLTQ